MQTGEFGHYRVSQCMLGTVQFGLDYGIANTEGQPSYSDAVEIVAAALDGGVNCLDTAAGYGSSEKVLGRVLQELHAQERLIVVTKVRPLEADQRRDLALARAAIAQSVEQSRANLGLDCLPAVLFHRTADAVYLPVLQELQQRGWLTYAGVSCDHDPGRALALAGEPAVGALQLPGSVLDRRHQAGGVWEKAAAEGVAIFNRSVYLQGLLVMPEDRIPPYLQAVVPIRRRLAAVAADAGLSLHALALRCMLGQPGVTSVLVGVETAAQMEENLRLFQQGPLTPEVKQAVDAVVPSLDEDVLTPSRWPALAEEKGDE